MNVLILTGKFGMGHFSAANNIAEKIQNNMSGVNVYVKDLFKQTFPEFQCGIMYNAYTLFVKKGSKIYNLVYKYTENVDKPTKFFLEKQFINSLEKLITDIEPSIIISTFPYCSKIVSLYKHSTLNDIALITCITDVSFHSDWINPFTNIYLAPTQSVKTGLINKGISQDKIIVSGIPVTENFKKVLKNSLDDKKRLLIMGGGLGLLPKNLMFYKKLNNIPNVITTVITGNNKVLYHRLHGKYANIEVVGFTDKVCEYMKNSDLIISKPGGITMFEAIFAELPLMTFNPFLQQEVKNENFIIENKLGVVLHDKPENSIEIIASIINDDKILHKIKTNMRYFKNQIDDDAITKILMRFKEVSA